MSRIQFLCVILLFVVVVENRSVSAADWPWWKGPFYDSQSRDTQLEDSWSEPGPPLIAQTAGLGVGFSNISLCGDKIYTLGDFDKVTYLVILDRKTLRILSKTEIGTGGVVGGFSGPKSTPSTDGTLVFAVNQNGILFAADAQTGKVLWKKHYYDDFDGIMTLQIDKLYWGYSESPLIDGDRLICVPGGKKGAVIALDKKSGKTLWRSTELTDFACYASVTPLVIDGLRQYMVVTHNQVSGIDVKDGRLLWQADCSGTPLAICTDPVCVDGYMFVSRGKLGGWGYHITRQDGRFQAKLVYRLKEVDNTHHGLICLDGLVYSSANRGVFYCFDLKTGEIRWRHRGIRNMTSLAYADKKLILRDERTGELILARPNADEWQELGRFRQVDRSDVRAWTWPVIVDRKMYIRDQDRLFVYDLAKGSQKEQK